MGGVFELGAHPGFYNVAVLGASALGVTLAHEQPWRCGAVSFTGSLPAVSGIEAMQQGCPCTINCRSPRAWYYSAWTHAPSLIDPLGVQQLRVLSTSCSSEAASILGLTACFPALHVCFYYKQQSALQGSLYKIMIHLVWKHFFHFFFFQRFP